MKPFFSVCISIQNREDTIISCLESICEQTFSNFELILVDCAPKKTKSFELVNKFIQSKHFKYANIKVTLKHKKMNPKGVSDWNEPLKLAKGKYIAILEGDDYFHDEYLEIAHKEITNNKNIGVWFTGNQNQTLIKKGLVKSEELFKTIYSLKQTSAPSQAIFKNDTKFKFNTEEYNYCPETELYINISLNKFDAIYNDQKLTYRSLSKNKNKGIGWYFYKDQYNLIKKFKHNKLITTKLYNQSLKRLFKSIIEYNLKEIILYKKINSKFFKQTMKIIGFKQYIKLLFSVINPIFLKKALKNTHLFNITYKIKQFNNRIITSILIIMNLKKEPFVKGKTIINYIIYNNIFSPHNKKNFKQKIKFKKGRDFHELKYFDHTIYYPNSFNEINAVANLNSIIGEQKTKLKKQTPHQYTSIISKNEIIYDLGSAEGLQAKMWLKKNAKMVLFEPDLGFYMALKKTFKKEIISKQVKIINYGIMNKPTKIDGMNFDTLTNLIKKYELELPTLIKADIEGSEIDFIKSSTNILKNENTKRINITTYHKPDDYINIKKELEKVGFKQITFNTGTIIFNRTGYKFPKLFRGMHPIVRKCVLLAEKNS